VGNPETLRPQRGRAPVTRGGKDELGPAGLDAIAARNYCRKAESKRLPEERGRGRRDRGCRRPGRHGRRWPMGGECSAAAAAVRGCGCRRPAVPRSRAEPVSPRDIHDSRPMECFTVQMELPVR
jgi:hypothetical protein